MPDCINVDIAPLEGVDVVHDLDIVPWPFDDGSIDEIRAHQVFEHVWNPVSFMREAHRVLRPRGTIHLVVPHYQSKNSFTDPTHKRHCTEETFDYWIVGTHLHTQFGGAYAAGANYEKIYLEREKEDLSVILAKI